MRAEIDPDPGPCEACRTQAPYRIPTAVDCPNGTNKIMRLCSDLLFRARPIRGN